MNRPYNTYQNNYEADIPYSYDIVFATPSPTPTQNHNHNRYESPVRDHNHNAFLLKTEEKFKDHYDVSNFKFSDVTATKLHTNHANFCELSFDGTKSTKHHHRKRNTIKRVTSTTTINCCPKKERIKEREIVTEHVRFQECEKEDRKDNAFQLLAEQFKNKLQFIEMPVKLHKQVICNPEERNRFEVILSPKTPASFSSLETMSNLLKSSEHRPKKIILTSNRMSRPHMRDREIQTAIIGIRNFHNMDECYNMRLTSVNDIFYNMNCRSSNEDDTFNFRQKKNNDKNNLTITHFPCLEIKCSSIFFEMPTNTVRTPMPRRTLDTSNVIIDDYNVACAAIEADKGSEPTVTVANSERTDPLKDKIFNLLSGTQIALDADYNQKVNDLCDLIGSLITENANKYNKNQKITAKRAADMYINIKKVRQNNVSSKRKTMISVPPSQKKYLACSGSEKSCHSISANERNCSRSVSPPSRPSTPSCQINKVATGETSPRESDKLYEKTFVNLTTAGMAEKKFSTMSIPSISSNESHRFKMVYKTSDDDILIKEREEFASPVPRDVFIIPPHVNKLLKSNTKKENRAKSANNAKTADFHLVNILKKPPTKQSWVVPDFPSKFQTKCDVVNHFQCMPSTKSKRGEHDCIGPSVTFSSMVDIIGGENDDSLEEPIFTTSPPINTIVPVITLPKQKPTTIPNKPEPPAIDDDGETFQNNCNVATFPGRPFEKPKAYEKQASFYNSSFFSLKKDTTAPTSSCLQKRKEYDSKLKRQMQNKQPSKIPLLKSNTEQDTESNAGKSKLPVKIADEVVCNKPPSFMKNQNQNQKPETSRLFTTDIKNTPFIQLRTESLLKKTDIPQMNTPRVTKSPRIHMNIQNMQTSLNVNKDVSRAENAAKEIIFIKHPEVDFHKPHIKFKMHHHWPPKTIEIPKNTITCNTTTTNNNNINMFMNMKINKNLTENTIKTPKFTKEYLTTQSENTKRQTTNNPQKLIFIFKSKEEPRNEPRSEGVMKKEPPKDYNTEYETFKRNKKKGNRVMFIEPVEMESLGKKQPVELESLCKIQKSQILYPAGAAKKPPKKPKPPPKKVLAKKVRPHKISKTIQKSKIHVKIPPKKVLSKSRKKKSQSGIIGFCDTMCCGCCGLCEKLRKRGREKAKKNISNLITCCTTLCSNIHFKNMIFRKQPPSMLPEQPAVQSSTYQVKSKVDKVYSINSFKHPTVYFVATTKGVLTTQKKQNPAWKFKDLLFKKMCQPYSPSKIPNALYNSIKYIQKDSINKMFPRFNIKEQENSIKIGAITSNHSSTVKISDMMKEYPNAWKKFKVINKGRFTRNTTSTGRNTTSSFRDVINTVYVPRSPRKVIPCAQPVSISPRKFNKTEPSYLLFPIKEEIKMKQKQKLNMPTFQFPWIKNIPYEPKTVEDLKLNTSRISKKADDKQIDIQQSPNIKKTLPKNIEDKPIINPSLPKKHEKDIKRPVIFDSETRKIYENRPKTPIPNRDSTATKNKEEKINKLPSFKKNMDKTISEQNINEPLLKRQNALRRRKISKLVLETNELVHIPDEDCLSVNSKDSKLTEYQSVVHYSGLSSNSQFSIASSSKRIPTISRTLLNIVGNFFRKYSKKVKSKKKKLMKDNG